MQPCGVAKMLTIHLDVLIIMAEMTCNDHDSDGYPAGYCPLPGCTGMMLVMVARIAKMLFHGQHVEDSWKLWVIAE